MLKDSSMQTVPAIFSLCRAFEVSFVKMQSMAFTRLAVTYCLCGTFFTLQQAERHAQNRLAASWTRSFFFRALTLIITHRVVKDSTQSSPLAVQMFVMKACVCVEANGCLGWSIIHQLLWTSRPCNNIKDPSCVCTHTHS